MPGSTSDPVSKSMGLLPIVSITVIDTARLDDEGELEPRKSSGQDHSESGRLSHAGLCTSDPDKTWEAKWLKTMAEQGGQDHPHQLWRLHDHQEHLMPRMKKTMKARVAMTNFWLTLAHPNGFLEGVARFQKRRRPVGPTVGRRC